MMSQGGMPPLRISRTYRILHRFHGKKRISVYIERPGVLFPSCPPEGIDGRSDLDIHKTGFLKHPFPACARQAPGDSARPQVDVADRRLRDRLAVRDIGEL